MDKDYIELSDDHLLMQGVMDDHGITIERLILLCGRAKSTLYKYHVGEATIPSIVWRQLYRLTEDPRICTLFVGEVPHVVVPLLNEPLRLDSATIKQQLKIRQEQIDCERSVLEIIEDGKIDHRDREAVEKFTKEFPRMISSQYQTYYAIMDEFERQTNAKRKN